MWSSHTGQKNITIYYANLSKNYKILAVTFWKEPAQTGEPRVFFMCECSYSYEYAMLKSDLYKFALQVCAHTCSIYIH